MLETLSLCQRRGESAEGEGRAARENGSIAVSTWPGEDIGGIEAKIRRSDRRRPHFLKFKGTC